MFTPSVPMVMATEGEVADEPLLSVAVAVMTCDPVLSGRVVRLKGAAETVPKLVGPSKNCTLTMLAPELCACALKGMVLPL